MAASGPDHCPLTSDLCHRLVDLMGGAMAVDSEPGRGTTFSIQLGFERAECIRGMGRWSRRGQPGMHGMP
jgi:hypothetical protein